jgi:hypothetical protein
VKHIQGRGGFSGGRHQTLAFGQAGSFALLPHQLGPVLLAILASGGMGLQHPLATFAGPVTVGFGPAVKQGPLGPSWLMGQSKPYPHPHQEYGQHQGLQAGKCWCKPP